MRDNLGRIIQRTEVLQGVTTTWGYVYDTAGRLQSVTRNGAAFESYTYDANDNRLTKTTTAGTTTSVYDNQDRLLSSSGLGGAQSWTYDSNGDVLTRVNASGTTVFDYDTTGQLLSVTKSSGQVVSYDLDAGSCRAVKRVSGTVQRKWLYAGGLLPVAEFDANDNLVATFNGSYMVKNGTTYRLLRDHLGSVRLVVDAGTGVVAQRLIYGPFGEILEDTNPGFQPFGYAGGMQDVDTGLVRFGARDYDPSIGRWTVKDPIELAAGPNLYAYCHNEPLNHSDPFGLSVDATYEVRTGQLTVVDTETGESQTFQAHSGNGPSKNNPADEAIPDKGPIPRGDYYIGDVVDVNIGSIRHPGRGYTGDSMWFPVLDKTTLTNEHPVRDADGNVINRFEFYIHPGRISSGCITFNSDAQNGKPDFPRSKEFTRLKDFIRKKSPLLIENNTVIWGVLHVR